MKLYPLPGGDWAGTEADWKKGMKAAGLNPKDFPNPTREVPTGKKELMEFLTFFAVDVYRTGGAPAQTPVDIDALRALHNPQPGDGPRPSDLTRELTTMSKQTPHALIGIALDDAFIAAPFRQQAQLVVAFIDTACQLYEDWRKN